jgi:hypothetical protein
MFYNNFRFPNSVEDKEIWRLSLKVSEEVANNPKVRICSNHFRNEDICQITPDSRKLIKRNVYPLHYSIEPLELDNSQLIQVNFIINCLSNGNCKKTIDFII